MDRHCQRLKNVTLKRVFRFILTIRRKSGYVGDRQLAIIHIDETQEMMITNNSEEENKKGGFFFELIEELWRAMIELDDTIVFPVLTGTHATAVYQRFASSGKRYAEIALAGLQPCHFQRIFESLGAKQVGNTFVELVQFALGGHPRLFRVMVSRLSWLLGKKIGSAEPTVMQKEVSK